MKISSLKSWLVLFVVVLLLGLGQKNQAFGQCEISFTGPAGNVLTSDIILNTNWWPPGHLNIGTSNSTFNVIVQDANEPLPVGIYLTWCVDWATDLDPSQGYTVPGTHYTGNLFPTCDPNLTNEIHLKHPDSFYVSPAVWHEVNYILNHKQGDFWDIQIAINNLVGGPPATNGTPGYPNFDPGIVQALLDDANNNAAAWVPKCGDVIGAVYDITKQEGTNIANMVQLVMLEVPILCPTANCATINAVLNTPITAVKLMGSGGCSTNYTFSATGLPNGLTMDSDGTIHGTPTQSGTFNYTVTVTDSCGNKGTTSGCLVTVNSCSGQIGDFIWNDQNGNGCQDAGEPGIAGVQVVLLSGDCKTKGTVIATNFTDNTGHYLFSGLCAGNYQVAIYTPAGFTNTLANVGCTNPSLPPPNNQIDSKCGCSGSPCITCVTLAANQVDLNVDCGYVCNGQIGDFVWSDINSNGCQDAGEPGIPGVKVDLYNTACSVTGTPIMSTNTDANGHYLFSGLCAGMYTVSFNQPSGYTRTVANAGCTNSVNPPYSNQTDSKCVCAAGTPCGVCVTLDANNPINLNTDCGYIPAPPNWKLFKSANSSFVLPGGTVTYSYVVTNTGSLTITNITVVDDNGTPGYTNDDFTVGTIASLAPGAFQTFTKTVLLPQQLCETINGTNVTVGSVITTVLPSGDIQVAFIQSLVNDNRYGTNATGWAGGHKFNDLVGSDKAEFVFTDSTGKTNLNVFLDYISAAVSNKFPSGVSNYPSGYGTLGVTGGDGSVISGGASNVLSATTSFTDDLNKYPVGFLVNSPKETAPLSGVSTVAPGWNYNDSYTIVVSKKAFGTNGFGGAAVVFVHNSPAKLGSDQFSPTNCNSCVVNVALARGTALNGSQLTAMSTAQVCIGTPPPCNVLGACTPPYPFPSTNALTSIAFNEPECLATNKIKVLSNCVPTQVEIFYSDEHAMTLGIRQLVTKTKVGSTIITTTNANYVITSLTTNPGSATNPMTGATIAQGGMDVSGRPIFPAMFVTDITTNPPNPLAGDWQYGGTPQPPTFVSGTWKGGVAMVDKTVTPNTFTVTPDADPTANNLILGPGSDPIPVPLATKDQAYTTEIRWDVSSLKDNFGLPLQSGHTYRLYFMVHDGDQNKAGGDVGQACGTITMP
jgi:hypothetical protein